METNGRRRRRYFGLRREAEEERRGEGEKEKVKAGKRKKIRKWDGKTKMWERRQVGKRQRRNI